MAGTTRPPGPDLVRDQVNAKWQEVFSRLNRDQPGISGLLSVSEVGRPCALPAIL
jgi:hypothetical protein